jgi:hypothetical protein
MSETFEGDDLINPQADQPFAHFDALAFDYRLERVEPPGFFCASPFLPMLTNCYNLALIKPLKASTIHLISAIFSASPIIPASGKLSIMRKRHYPTALS